MRKAFVATVQIVVHNVNSDAEASDAISGLFEFSDPKWILDWAYLKLGGQHLYPTEDFYQEPYAEGDFLSD